MWHNNPKVHYKCEGLESGPCEKRHHDLMTAVHHTDKYNRRVSMDNPRAVGDRVVIAHGDLDPLPYPVRAAQPCDCPTDH